VWYYDYSMGRKLESNLFLGCAALVVLSMATGEGTAMSEMAVSPTLQVTLTPKQAGGNSAPVILLGRAIPQITVVLKNVSSTASAVERYLQLGISEPVVRYDRRTGATFRGHS